MDYVIVGAGLYGATFARYMADRGKKVIVVDRRPHIGGNVYTERVAGIDVHKYGPHIFHTNSKAVWEHVNQFAIFNTYRHKVLVNAADRLFSFPINLKTLEQAWPRKKDPLEHFHSVRGKYPEAKNLEEFAINEVGEELYRTFIYGYTKKHWGREPRDLPSSIISRIPVREDYNDDYHKAKFSGIPLLGYTEMVQNMLDGITVVLDEDFLARREYWEGCAKNIVYTGPIDEFFDYEHGELAWRSLRFEQHTLNAFQVFPVAQINFPSLEVNHTRIVEHKHFVPETFNHSKQTVITHEYPQPYEKGREKYYPINDDKNKTLYHKYRRMIPKNYVFGGRLANYKYYDMDQVIASALKEAEKHA